MTRSGWMIGLLATLLLTGACGSDAPEAVSDALPEVRAGTAPYAIAEAGVFNLGGELVPVHGANIDGTASGTVWAHHLLVSYFLPDAPNPAVPVVMLPGFGLSKDIYLTAPDGRPGWAIDFVRAGHPVYLVEPANSVRAGIDPEQLNAQIADREGGRGVLFTWTRELAIPRFGFGTEEGELFADGQLEPSSWEALSKMFTPVWVPQTAGVTMIESGLPYNLAGLNQLLDQIGPAILLVHSATGLPGFALAAQRPDDVLAVINIEPVGCPAAGIEDFPDVPVLSMFADHMEVRPQMPARQQECQQVVDALAARGVPAAMLALPEMGIRGNSHLPMSERNSSDLATLLLDWIDRSIDLD